MTRATFEKSCGLASRCTSDATVRIWYGDMFSAVAVSSSPPCSYCVALAEISVDRMSSAVRRRVDVPGARRDQAFEPAVVRSHPVDGCGRPLRHAEQPAALTAPAVLRRSSADTHRRSPSRSTHVAFEISVRMPSVTALVFTSCDVVELAALRDDQQADPVCRIGEALDGVGGRNLGAHLVEARLDRRDRRSCRGGVDESLDGRDHVVVVQASGRSRWWSHRRAPGSRRR